MYLHNTLNIVGHIHLVLLMGSVLLAFGLTYSILPSITGKTLSRKLGAMHLILTNIGGFGLAFLFLFLGFAGFIRREGDIPSEFAWANAVVDVLCFSSGVWPNSICVQFLSDFKEENKDK